MEVSRPFCGEWELEALSQVVRSGQWAQGKEVAALEREFSALMEGLPAVALNSGTSALWAALHSLGIGPGQEVAVPAFSFAASASCVLHNGALPVFVDVEEGTGNMDVLHLEQLLCSRPQIAAVVVVHLYGRPVPLPPILELARRHGIFVVEDCAQSLGAKAAGRPVGLGGDASCFSFYATKNVACGEGGMVITRDEALAQCIRLFINHGQSSRYHHVSLGYNLRMSDIHAALARVQMKRLPDFLARRRAIARHYQTSIDHPLIHKPVWDSEHGWHLYTVRCPKRDALAAHLKEAAVPTAIHYPTTIPQQPLFISLGYTARDCPVAEQLSQEVLSLPLHPGLEQSDVRQVSEAVNSFPT